MVEEKKERIRVIIPSVPALKVWNAVKCPHCGEPFEVTVTPLYEIEARVLNEEEVKKIMKRRRGC